MKDLEKQLAEQKLKPIPTEWRGQILSAAAERSNEVSEMVPLFWWRALIWPSPRAWAALAGAWLLVALIQLTMPSVNSSTMAPAAVMSAGAAEAWREQQRLLVELFPQERRAEPPRALPPRRRSEGEHDFHVA